MQQLPKLMELIGLGYTGWFVYRYLLFKVKLIPLISFLLYLHQTKQGIYSSNILYLMEKLVQTV